MGKYLLSWIWNLGNFKTAIWSNIALHCSVLTRKKNVDDSSLSGPSASLRTSQITHNWNDPTVCLAHVFLVSYYEWKIHNYLFKKQHNTTTQKTTTQKQNFFICIVKTLFVWKQDQELLLNSKSACVGWTMSGTELKKNHFCAQRFWVNTYQPIDYYVDYRRIRVPEYSHILSDSNQILL